MATARTQNEQIAGDPRLPPPPDEIRALIAEGLAAGGILPPIDRLRVLDERLRTEIERLIPVIEWQVTRVKIGSPAWDRRGNALRLTHAALEEDLGPGLRSAALHVRTLAIRCQWLTRYKEEW